MILLWSAQENISEYLQRRMSKNIHKLKNFPYEDWPKCIDVPYEDRPKRINVPYEDWPRRIELKFKID